MKCEKAQQHIVLVTYGELPDEQLASLEEHLAECEACNRELKALLAMHEALAYKPMVDPSPNLLAQSRMRLDEELDTIPPHGLLTRLRSNLFGWLGHMQSAPALMTLLVGVGFLGGHLRQPLSGGAPAKAALDGGAEQHRPTAPSPTSAALCRRQTRRLCR